MWTFLCNLNIPYNLPDDSLHLEHIMKYYIDLVTLIFFIHNRLKGKQLLMHEYNFAVEKRLL